jgi:hypothetical protein
VLHTDSYPAGQGTRDALCRRTREDSDNDENDQVHGVKEVKLLRGHAFFSRRLMAKISGRALKCW